MKLPGGVYHVLPVKESKVRVWCRDHGKLQTAACNVLTSKAYNLPYIMNLKEILTERRRRQGRTREEIPDRQTDRLRLLEETLSNPTAEECFAT